MPSSVRGVISAVAAPVNTVFFSMMLKPLYFLFYKQKPTHTVGFFGLICFCLGQGNMIALRKSDNSTDLIPPNQCKCTPAPAFGIRPFPPTTACVAYPIGLLLAKCASTVCIPMITHPFLFVKDFFETISSNAFGNANDQPRGLFFLLFAGLNRDTASPQKLY